MKTIITRTLITGALLFATSAFAADTQPSPQPAPDKLSAVRAQIAAKNFPGAIDELKRVNDTGDADWNNLMGYSLRKAPTPDFAGAEKFYNEGAAHRPQAPRRARILGRALPADGRPREGRAAPRRARQGVLLQVRGIQRPQEGHRAIQGQRQQGFIELLRLFPPAQGAGQRLVAVYAGPTNPI